MGKPILVTGGTGTLGRALVRRLLAAGDGVRVLSRKERPAEHTPYEWAQGDLRRGQGLVAAVDGVETIVHCASSMGGGDVLGMRNLVAAARGAGRPHLIYISIVGVDCIPLPYYAAKAESERLLENADLPWTILRATQFHDLIARLCSAQWWLPTIMMPAGVSFQPVDSGDVADRLTEIVGQPVAGRVPNMGGPQIRAGTELARSYRDARGMRRGVLSIRLPGATVRGYRAGAHLAAEQAVGRGTFDEFLVDFLSERTW